jgi:serine/threonine protein kinase
MKKCPRCGIEYPDTITLCPADGAGLESTSDPLVGETLAGKYRVEERLSVGGMGTVYRGTHILMGKTVAIKVLRPSLAADETIVARFSREARAASKISHPHALSVTDFGEDEGGVVFLIMEFLNGRTLKEVIRKDGPLPLSRAVEIMRQVCSALDAAHAEGVVHRDLKSDNIMLINSSGADYAKVLDFGIAKIQEPTGPDDAALTSPDLIIGTPQYMSPEQCSQSETIDSRTDIYSLGVILYEMLVGHVPFVGDSPTTVMLKHLQETAPSVLEERKDLPVGVETVVAKALAKNREDRYQSAGQMVEDLVIAEGTGLVQPELGDRNPSQTNETTVSSRPAPVEDDEQTLVRTRAPVYVPPSPVARPQTTPSAASFNPWRIVIPSLAALLVVFGVIYVFTRASQPAANSNQSGQTPGLSADPNSQAVQPVAPPTGQNEQGIPLGGATNPNPNTNTNVNADSNANVNANSAVSPTPASNENANAANPNDSPPPNANSNKPPELPSPRHSPQASPQSTNPLTPSPTLPPVTPRPTTTPPPPPGR